MKDKADYFVFWLLMKHSTSFFGEMCFCFHNTSCHHFIPNVYLDRVEAIICKKLE